MQAPLAGVKVVDLSAVVSGPMAAGILADQGADVIKVETRQGDLTRVIGPIQDDLTPLFIAINRGKRSIVLDLKKPQGARVLRDLVAGADVLVENFRPGALARLGFSYEAVADYNPAIVYLSIAGFGHSGPFAGYRVYDPVIQAVSGFAAAHPDPDTGEPKLLQTLLCDKITALTAAQAVCAALHARKAGGRGQKIELSMLDAAVSFLWPEALYNHSFIDAPPSTVPEFGANQKLWSCKDGWLAMITPQDDEFSAMCRVFGVPQLVDDPRFATILSRRSHQRELRALLEPIAAAQPVDDLAARLGAAGVPVGRVNAKDQLAQDPQVRHNGLLEDTPYPGLGRVRSPRPAAVFPATQRAPAPRAAHLGEHTREILSGLGLGSEEIDALLASGAAFQGGARP